MPPKPPWVYLVGSARKVWRWNPERRECKRLATVNNDPRFYMCAICGGAYKNVQVDHIKPVGKAPKEWKGWDSYYKRLFCPLSNLRVLCLRCHASKTRAEATKTKTRQDNNETKTKA